MKHFQLLTFVLTTLPSCIDALVLGTGISSSSTLSGNQSSTISSSSTSSSSSSSLLSSSSSSLSSSSPSPSSSSSTTQGAQIGDFVAAPFVQTSTSAPISNSSSSSWSSTSETAFPTLFPNVGDEVKDLNKIPPSGGFSLSSSFPFFPTGSVSGFSAQGTGFALATGGAKYAVRPIHKPSLAGNSTSAGFPQASITAGQGLQANVVFPTGTGGLGSPKKFLGTGGFERLRAGTGVASGIFPSGTGSLGTGDFQRLLAGTGGVKNGVFPSGTNARLTASGGANSSVPTRAASCGLCDVIIPQVQVQYFTSGAPSPCAASNGAAGPTITPPPAPSLVKRRLGRRNGTYEEMIAVSDGYTFSSPSMYVVMSQGIQVTDLCGTIGSSMASAVVPISSGALSSVSYDIPVGATLTNAVMSAQSYTKPVRPEDLACPTWGISGNWNPRPESDPLEMPGGIDLNIPAPAAPGATTLALIGVVEDNTVVGAPWYPILVLPHEVLGLDPLWAACEGRLVNPSFPIFDPPHVLQGQTELLSSAGPAVAQAEVTTAAQADPGNNPPLGTVKIAENQLVAVASPGALAPTATIANGDNNPPPPPALVSPVADTIVRPPANSPVVQAPANSPVVQAPANPPSDQVLANSLNAALQPVSTINVVPVPDNPPPAANPTPLSVAGQPVHQAAGSTLVVGGSSIAPGSTGSVSGHQVVNNGDNVVVDGSSQAIQPNPTPAPAPTPLPTVGGQQIQQAGSNLVVAGQTIAPGSTGSVAGHQVVNDGKNVVVDGSSQAIQPTPAAAALPTVGGQPIVQSGNNLVVAGQTIAPGSTGSVAGHAVVNNGNNVVVDGSSQPIQPAPLTPVLVANTNNPGATGVAPAFQGEGGNVIATPPPALPSVGGQQIQQQGSNLVVGGQTITPGATATVGGHQVVNSGSAVAIDGSTQAIPPSANITPNSPPLVVDGSTYLPTGPSSAYILPGGQTLTPGAQATVNGIPVSLAPDGHAAVVGGSTENLSPTITPPPGLPAITFGGSTYQPTGASSAYVIGGQTLTPGGSAITVSGTPISLYGNGATAIVGSSTEALQPPITSAPGLTFDGTTYQPTNIGSLSSAYVINGQTITPGAAPVTISGTPISVAANGASAVVGKVTEQLAPSGSQEPALTFDGSTFLPVTTGSPSNYVIDGQTLTPGGQITVSGTPISLASNAASAVIGTSTENLQMTEPPLVFGGSTYYPTGPSSAYVIDGQTITRGESTTLSGTPISLASDGSSAVVGTSTEDLKPSLTAGAVLTVGGQSFTPNPSQFILGGKTMTVGGSAIISGTPVELEPSGTLMVGTSEIPLATSSGSLVASGNPLAPSTNTAASPTTNPGGQPTNLILSPTNPPLTGSAAGRQRISWSHYVSMGFVGFGILYIV